MTSQHHFHTPASSRAQIQAPQPGTQPPQGPALAPTVTAMGAMAPAAAAALPALGTRTRKPLPALRLAHQAGAHRGAVRTRRHHRHPGARHGARAEPRIWPAVHRGYPRGRGRQRGLKWAPSRPPMATRCSWARGHARHQPRACMPSCSYHLLSDPRPHHPGGRCAQRNGDEPSDKAKALA